MKKYSVFLSSTHADLKEVRWDILHEIMMAGCFPVAAEFFGARDESSIEVLEREIESADFFLLIVAGSKGSRVSELDARTFVELEFDHAIRHRKPIRVYVREGVPNEGESLPFLRKVEQSRLASYWVDKNDLLRRIGNDLRQLTADHDRHGTTGWIPARLAWNHEAANRINRVYEQLEGQLSQISTQYLGMFPSYVPRIVDLIDKEGEVVMVCDVPGYGMFSAPRDKYLAYEGAIWRSSGTSSPRFRAVLYSEDERREELENQFHAEDWDRWKRQFHDNLQTFYRSTWREFRGDPDERISELDRAGFVSDCLSAHRSIQSRIFDRDNIREFGARYPFHFWVNRDQSEAVFSFPTYPSVDDRDPAEHGFMTRDPQLADSLINLFRFFWKQGSPSQS